MLWVDTVQACYHQLMFILYSQALLVVLIFLSWTDLFAGEYFPRAYIDTISVWEDESTAFDVLANDYFAGNNASVVEYSKVQYKVKVFKPLFHHSLFFTKVELLLISDHEA